MIEYTQDDLDIVEIGIITDVFVPTFDQLRCVEEVLQQYIHLYGVVHHSDGVGDGEIHDLAIEYDYDVHTHPYIHTTNNRMFYDPVIIQYDPPTTDTKNKYSMYTNILEYSDVLIFLPIYSEIIEGYFMRECIDYVEKNLDSNKIIHIFGK